MTPAAKHHPGRLDLNTTTRLRRLAIPLTILLASALPRLAAAPPINAGGGPSWPGDKHPPRNTCDGNPSSFWAGDPKAEKWTLSYDLGAVRAIPSFTVDYFSTRYMAANATVDISTDGHAWQPLGTMPAAAPSTIDIGQPLRYLRINFAGKAKDKQPAIREVAFGTPLPKTKSAPPPSPIPEITYRSSADDTLQPARAFLPDSKEPVPLVVGLHTWSGTYKQHSIPAIEKWCMEKGWAYIHPHFRGPNWTPEATGSELVVKDITSAVEHMKQSCSIDTNRVYLVAVSGGGYHALLMAGRRPDIWAGVSAWVPISDLTAWHNQCRAKSSGYATHIVKSCGGKPGDSAEVDQQLKKRSPVTYLAKAAGLPLDINAGIHDGHSGSVPISHSLIAFNLVAAPEDRISAADIDFMTTKQQIPEHLKRPLNDPSYGKNTPLFRRQSGQARITIFEGGHQINAKAAIEWLSMQQKRQ